MFLNKTIENNKKLIDFCIEMHKNKKIAPDTYVIDVDVFIENAKKILEKAKHNGVGLFFMLKQVGRNPYLAKKLIEIGYEGCVAVDFNEAKVMIDNNIPLGNVGHLVQIPSIYMEEIVKYGSKVFTVFSFEKLQEINLYSEKYNKISEIIIKIYDENDKLYPSQEGGIKLKDLKEFCEKSKPLKNIKIVGITSFPTLLFDENKNNIEKTNNFYTVLKGKEILKECGIDVKHVNLPSSTCYSTLDYLSEVEYAYGEPGHGLSATTPLHACMNLEEKQCVVYLSEISHVFNEKSYFYGGGYYRRGNLYNALVSHSHDEVVSVDELNCSSIDYYLCLNKPLPINSTVICAFRFQIFVTRSKVCLIEGLSDNKPRICGVYDSLGKVSYE